MGELEELEKDMLISQKIENILRNVEGHILLYYEHYKGLSEQLSGSEKEEDLKKISNCIPSLEGATVLIAGEIRRFEFLKTSIIQKTINRKDHGLIKARLNQVQAHMNTTLSSLSTYINGLRAMLINGNNAKIAKKVIEKKAEDIQSAYNIFVRNNEACITDMQDLIQELGIKNIQTLE